VWVDGQRDHQPERIGDFLARIRLNGTGEWTPSLVGHGDASPRFRARINLHDERARCVGRRDEARAIGSAANARPKGSFIRASSARTVLESNRLRDVVGAGARCET
jgi:secreted PhoX family phosphatase